MRVWSLPCYGFSRIVVDDTPMEKVTVMGLGYVGTHMIRMLRSSGFDNQVVGYDPNESQVKKLEDETREEDNNLFTSDVNDLGESNVWVVCVPTPLTEGEPDLGSVLEACLIIADLIREEDLIIIESTLGVCDTRTMCKLITQTSGFDNIHVAYCPERLNPPITNEQKTPRVISGITKESKDMAMKFYEPMSGILFGVDSPEVAELSKLYENTYRAVNVALANEVADVCRMYDISTRDVFDAAGTKSFGFDLFRSGIGVGGHCIPIDPVWLIDSAETMGGETPLVCLAQKLNTRRPHQIALRVKTQFDNQAPIMVLGVAYKPNVDDVRESPAIEIIEDLIEEGFVVKYHDPFVPTITIKGKQLHSEELTEENVKQTLLLVAHEYDPLCFKQVYNHAKTYINAIT